MKIISKKNAGRMPVYDLTVAHNSQYSLANGVVTHNTAMTYNPNVIFVITKAQEKTGTEVTGYRFTLNVHKSRFVKEKSKLPFSVDMNEGINMYSSLMDLALQSGHCVKPSNGWYQKIDPSTGEVADKKYRLQETNTESFWGDLLADESFKEWIRGKFQYGE